MLGPGSWIQHIHSTLFNIVEFSKFNVFGTMLNGVKWFILKKLNDGEWTAAVLSILPIVHLCNKVFFFINVG